MDPQPSSLPSGLNAATRQGPLCVAMKRVMYLGNCGLWALVARWMSDEQEARDEDGEKKISHESTAVEERSRVASSCFVSSLASWSRSASSPSSMSTSLLASAMLWQIHNPWWRLWIVDCGLWTVDCGLNEDDANTPFSKCCKTILSNPVVSDFESSSLVSTFET